MSVFKLPNFAFPLGHIVFKHSAILTPVWSQSKVFLNLRCALQLKREKQHLESELERAERESATYVTEVREVSEKRVIVSQSCDPESFHGCSSSFCKRMSSVVCRYNVHGVYFSVLVTSCALFTRGI